MAEPHRMRKETYVEVSRFPGRRHQMPLSGITLGLSCIVFILFFNQKYALEEAATAIMTACSSFLAIGLPQFLEFRRISQEILSSGTSKRSRPHGKKEIIKAGLEIAFFLMMILGPFILSFFTPSIIWLNLILGIIMGLSSFQFFFTLYVRLWERAHAIKLSRFTTWSLDERNRRIVLEYEVRSEKS